jgi:hypothetical protein
MLGGSGQRGIWIAIAGALCLLLVVLGAPVWLPAVSWFIPDRYIMAYAPPPIQKMIFQVDPNSQVPTPVLSAAEQSAAGELLANLVPTATPTSTPLPHNPLYIQPTPPMLAPTATFTPVFSVAVDPRAQDKDNEADLSKVTTLLTGFKWDQQGYNNCGPASITVLMSYWGIEFTEKEAASFLKPDPEDPNVRPDEIGEFVEKYGYHALIRVNGDFDTIRKFILAGYPVLIESGYNPEPNTVGWTSHYLTLVGYSDAMQGFVAMDTYRRPNWFYAYNEVDYYWRQFNRRYIIIYRDNQYAAVSSIIGENLDDTKMYEDALVTAHNETTLSSDDPYAWFNLGNDLTALGRYEDAVVAFDKARSIGLPSRFLWYQFTPYEAYLKVGRYDDVITLADAVLAKKPSEEAYYFKGLALLGKGERDKAKIQIAAAVRANKNYEAAREELDQLKQ